MSAFLANVASFRPRQSWDGGEDADARPSNSTLLLRPLQGPVHDFASFIVFLNDMFISDPFYSNINLTNDLQLSGIIGEGAQFVVRRLVLQGVLVVRTSGRRETRRSKGDAIVLKRPKLAYNSRGRFSEPHVIENITQELRVLSHPYLRQHQNILDIFGIAWEIESEGSLFDIWPVLPTEYAEFGTLEDYLAWDVSRDYKTKLQLCCNVAAGIQGLHDCRIIHSDLKLTNILICGTKSGGVVAKLSDFGLSIFLDEFDTSKRWERGTAPWMAPEWRTVVPIDLLHKTDIYSCGLILWSTLLNGQEPWDRSALGPENGRLEAFKLHQKSDSELLGYASMTLDALSYSQQQEIMNILKTMLRISPSDRSLTKILSMSRTSMFFNNPQSKGPPSQEHSAVSNPQSGEEIFLEYFELMSLPWRVQRQIRKALESIANSEEQSTKRRAAACYSLCIFYIQRIGILEPNNLHDPWDGYKGYSPDYELSMEWLRRATELGSSVARANYSRLASAYSVHNIRDLVPPQEVKAWLELSTKEGSLVAAEELRNLDLDAWKHANESYRHEFCGVGRNLFGTTAVQLPPGMPEFTEYLSKRFSATTSLILNDRGDNLIHWAAMTGRASELVHILNQEMTKEYLNSVNMANETALVQACRSGHHVIVHELLKRGVDAAICTSSGENGLHWLGSFVVAEVELISIAKAIVSAGAKAEQVCKPNNQYNPKFARQISPGTPLQRATFNRDIRSVRVLLSLGADPYFGFMKESGLASSAIELACSYHDAEIAALFLPPRYPMKHPRWYKNQQAMSLSGILQTTWQMLKQDLDDAPTSLLGASLCPQPLFRRMLRYGSHCDANMRSTISRLIEEGESIYRVDYQNCSALLCATWGRDLSIVSHLMRSFPDDIKPLLNYPTANGLAMKLPIHASINLFDRLMFEELVRYLPMSTPLTVPEGLTDWVSNVYRAGLEVKSCTMANHPVSTQICSIIHLMAASVTDVCFANQVLDSLPRKDLKTMITQTGTYGDFPLQLAIINHSFEIASLFIAQGADINQETGAGQCKGWTPLGSAIALNNGGSPETISWLLRNGANLIVNQETQTSAIQIAIRLPIAPRTTQADNRVDGALKFLQRPDTKNLELVLNYFHTPEHLNHQDTQFGYTAMHWAINGMDTAAIKVLVDKCASLEIEATNGPAKGMTPLQLAFAISCNGVPEEVLKRGSKITMKFLSRVEEILETLGIVKD